LRSCVPNKNTVARLRSNILATQKFWAGYANAKDIATLED